MSCSFCVLKKFAFRLLATWPKLFAKGFFVVDVDAVSNKYSVRSCVLLVCQRRQYRHSFHLVIYLLHFFFWKWNFPYTSNCISHDVIDCCFASCVGLGLVSKYHINIFALFGVCLHFSFSHLFSGSAINPAISNVHITSQCQVQYVLVVMECVPV